MDKEIIESLKSEARELVEKIREFSRSQKEIWQKIPFLALKADGRPGYSDQCTMACLKGYWPIESGEGYYAVYVDLENGELVDALNPREKAGDEDVISIATNLGQIDASVIAKKLEDWAKRPAGLYSEEEKQKKDNEIAVEYGLNPDTYKRKIDPKEVYEENLTAFQED